MSCISVLAPMKTRATIMMTTVTMKAVKENNVEIVISAVIHSDHAKSTSTKKAVTF